MKRIQTVSVVLVFLFVVAPAPASATYCQDCLDVCNRQYQSDRRTCSYIPAGQARTACYNEAAYNKKLCMEQCYIDYNDCPECGWPNPPCPV